MRKLLLVMLFLVIVVQAHASSSFYVDIAMGDDKYPGTLHKPWKNLNTAVSKMQDGDSLYVRAGDYRKQGVITIENQATELFPIRILAYEGEQPVVAAESRGIILLTSMIQL